jgi:hypothetical protein
MTQCTALVPVNAMDTQVLAVINKITKKDARQEAMASIKATTDNICIEGAISILQAFGYDKDTIHVGSNKWVADDLQDENYFPELQGRMASETPILWFWGGPPTKLRWYKGTLQTLLDDRVLYEIVRVGHAQVARAIGTDHRL